TSGIYTKKIKGYDVKIPITSITDHDDGQDHCIGGNCLNNCLEDNLIDPRGDQNTLSVNLSYSPDNPVNDATAENSGDMLTFSAAVNGSLDPAHLKYRWEIYGSQEINPDGWGNPYLKSELSEASPTVGIGLSTFEFKLNFPYLAPKYLKAKVSVSESLGSGSANHGSAEIIIPISSSEHRIRVFSTSANSSLELSLQADRERCSYGLDSALCPIIKNEIVGLRASSSSDRLLNVRWTLDGESVRPMSCSTAACNGSGNCDCDPRTGENNEVAYFPILKDKGSRYSVTMTANTAGGERINVTKSFEVVDPKVKIVSADRKTCSPVLLGSYIDLDGASWPDYSEIDFSAVSGATISLKPELNMPFFQNYSWFIDGTEATSLGAEVRDDGTLSFTANKVAGETYSVSIGGLYAQDNNVKKILSSSYGVQFGEFYEKVLGDSVELSMTDSLGSQLSGRTDKKILASMATNLPGYFNFLFRIVMTVLLTLFICVIFSAFFPKNVEN
ncbi:MAG TPA: hypothetical protein DIT25_00425, partial [Candidatus Moranbacteria bacterium]|nr:hypothetical protein [Candidatus Moranbacteria bacterium]